MNKITETAFKARTINHGINGDHGGFERISELWMLWSLKTFDVPNEITSLLKAKDELIELVIALSHTDDSKKHLFEYVDVIMCILHSAAKKGYTIQQITDAFREKASINFNREWVQNENGTYSHKK
jgi:hypothetical protein